MEPPYYLPDDPYPAPLYFETSSENLTKRITTSSSPSVSKLVTKGERGPSLMAPVVTVLQASPVLSDIAISSILSRRSQPLSVMPGTDFEHMDSNKEALFLCTFCWVPQFAPAKSHALGRESRIACRACWERVLDLSICWVCGEIIVRGEDVVSAGWCFWHRACFGCVFCKQPMIAPQDMSGGNGGDEDGGDIAVYEQRMLERIEKEGKAAEDGVQSDLQRVLNAQKKRAKATEIQMLPECSSCREEEEQRCQVEGILPPSLAASLKFSGGKAQVSRSDRGLSESRWEMLLQRGREKEGELRMKARTLEKEKGSSIRESQIGKLEKRARQESLTGLMSGAASIGSDETRSPYQDGSSACNSPAQQGYDSLASSAPDQVYLSIFNPLGEPPFKASETKPIPRWMSLLPNNVHRGRDPDRTGSPNEISAYSSLVGSLDEDSLLDSQFAAPTTSLSSSVDSTIRGRRHAPINRPVDPGFAITNLPSSPPLPASGTRTSVYTTPPEFPITHDHGNRRQSVNLSQRPPSANVPTSYFTKQNRSVTEPAQGTSSTDKIPPSTPSDKRSASIAIAGATHFSPPSSVPQRRPTPFVGPTSSEYLDLYQPKTPDPRIARYVPKEMESVVERFKRRRTDLNILAEEDVEGSRKEDAIDRPVKEQKQEVDEEDIGAVLRLELKRLFNEK